MKLFGDVPDVERLRSDTGLDADTVECAVRELAWITKAITRIGKGYILGEGHPFSRPGSAADLELDVALRAVAGGHENPLASPDSTWVSEEELANALADRTGLDLGVADAIVDGVAVQVEDVGGGLTVARKLFELERVVEDQLMEDPFVLAPWGWSFEGEPMRQVHLGSGSRADIVGQLTDGSWLVVELKRGGALTETADQILRYVPLVREKFAAGEQVTGLVVADGDDAEFHERIKASGEVVVYQPVRALNLPACRPQTHRVPAGSAATLTVAADGLTAVAATGVEAFSSASPTELWTLGRRVLDGSHEPQPLPPLMAH